MSDVSSTSSTPSGMTGAGGGSMIRITGMGSGLDVDGTVKKMMAGDQAKLDKAKQDEQTIQWKQSGYQDIITEIKNLQSSFFDSASSDNNIISSTNFSPFTVSGVGTSTVDTSVATLTPGVGAQTGTYSILVNKLATGAGVTNTVKTLPTATPPSASATLSTPLSSISTSLKGSIQLALNVNGSTSPINVTLDNTSGNATIGDLVNAINNTGAGSVKASFSELTGQFKLNTTALGSSASLTIGTGTTSALSNIIGFSTAATGTTDPLANGTTDAGTTTSNWVVTNTAASNPQCLGTGTIQNSQNADVTITPPGGSPVTLNDANGNARTSNNFNIDGMSYSLSSVSTTPATVSVGSDTQKVYDKIKSFIDKYNTVVDDIQSKLTEKPDPNYKPLTDAQKSSMSASDIAAWETKAKVGILRNDNNLQTMLNGLTSAFTTAVSNTGLSFGQYGSNSIGIDTSSDYTKPGHIDIVDPMKLQAAISSNSDQILKMFTNVSTATDGSTNYSASTQQYQQDGIFTRIKNIFQTNVGFTNTTLNTAILTSYANQQYDYSTTGTGGKGTIPDQIYEQQLMVKKITDDMSTKQEQYYQQFSQLDTVMSTLNSQQAQLSSLTSG